MSPVHLEIVLFQTDSFLEEKGDLFPLAWT